MLEEKKKTATKLVIKEEKSLNQIEEWIEDVTKALFFFVFFVNSFKFNLNNKKLKKKKQL